MHTNKKYYACNHRSRNYMLEIYYECVLEQIPKSSIDFREEERFDYFLDGWENVIWGLRQVHN